MQKKTIKRRSCRYFLNTSVNESLQLFKPNILNAIEIIRDKKKKRPDIDTMHVYIMKTEASDVGKTLK